MTELSLFVYGSLSEGRVHFSKISSFVVSKASAAVKAEVYRLPSGYPALVAPLQGQPADFVSGELVRLKAPDLVFRLLDEYHGYNLLVPEKSLYKREDTDVQLLSGEVLRAVAYFMQRSKLPKAAQKIDQGDWVQDMTSQPPLFQSLTERQAQYIRRLSASSGREIIPIDIALYRELLKLDLIVDKGRRLALSKLGKEVIRYLPEA